MGFLGRIQYAWRIQPGVKQADRYASGAKDHGLRDEGGGHFTPLENNPPGKRLRQSSLPGNQRKQSTRFTAMIPSVFQQASGELPSL
jgi:hypothetical protein